MRILPILSWLFLIPFFTVLFGIDGVSVSGQCPTDQSSLLLQFKNSLNFSSTVSERLVDWNQTSDCCQWKGVTCDQAGHVTGLELDNESIVSGIDQSSSLFRLQFLERLNLASNSFNSTQIPPSFGNLTSLKHLNLSNAGFAGQIPIELSRLTRLVTLDLSNLYFAGALALQLQNPNLSNLIQNLSQLTELYLDGVYISAPGSEWGRAISSWLPNLRVLSLSNCYLSGPIDDSLKRLQYLSEIHLGSNNLAAPVPEFFANFWNLTHLRLSSTNLSGTFPNTIFQLPSLQVLDLANNKLLQGSLLQFPQNASLQSLVLSNTIFSGNLPDSIGNLRKLSRLDLTVCNFSGPIPISMTNLTQLVYLDLSGNNFTGPIPSFQMSRNLSYIDLSHNALAGEVSSTHFEGLSKLVYIDLAYNSFNGSIPSSLFTLPYLQKIQLNNNHFGGQVTGFSNQSLPPLDTLDLSSNKLQGPIPSSFFDFRKLNILSLSFNNFSGNIQLEKIRSLQNLTRLELSNNNLSVNAGSNNSGLFSQPQLSVLKLASCKLRKIPALENQSRMIQLDLSDNQIPGEIPNWIWKLGNGSLSYLNLSCNLLDDLQRPYTIPSVLSVIDLHSNHLSGEIPYPPEFAIYVDYSSNNFSSSMPDEIGSNLTFVSFFSVSNNSLTGAIPESVCKASNVLVLDLSKNRFNGPVPQCLIEGCTKTLGVLNFRNNNLTGNISGTFPQSCALKTLDFNGNHLEGQVPKSLANCKNLEVLNLGNNNITDTFPCFLKNSSSLRVLVLRSNKFQGNISCEGVGKNTWPRLQIIDLALNNLSGDLPPKCFLSWTAMMVNGGDAQSDHNHLYFEVLKFNNFYYQDTVTVTNKGLEMELVKILTLFTSIDFSCNNFQGEIPVKVGALKSLYVLNLSHNALTGHIPPTLGNLSQLGSLDLSMNKLNGSIPPQLTSLTFLSFLDLSYNHLVGMIPTGSQFDTFSNSSYEGNRGLCGCPLTTRCNNNSSLIPPPTPSSKESGSVNLMARFDWQFIYTGLGFGVGAGCIVGPLLFWKKGSKWCDEHIEKFAWMILPTLGFIFTCCKGIKVDSDGKFEEEPFDDGGAFDEDEDENHEMEGKPFAGRYCVFCSKLDIRRKKVIHNPTCSCHESPPISCSSSSSSSSSQQHQITNF